MANFFSFLLNVLLACIKAVWNAAVSIIWGVAGALTLTGLIVYFKQDPSIIGGLMKLVGIIIKYWVYIFVCLFLFEVVINYRKLK